MFHLSSKKGFERAYVSGNHTHMTTAPMVPGMMNCTTVPSVEADLGHGVRLPFTYREIVIPSNHTGNSLVHRLQISSAITLISMQSGPIVACDELSVMLYRHADGISHTR